MKFLLTCTLLSYLLYRVLSSGFDISQAASKAAVQQAENEVNQINP